MSNLSFLDKKIETLGVNVNVRRYPIILKGLFEMMVDGAVRGCSGVDLVYKVRQVFECKIRFAQRTPSGVYKYRS